MYQGIQCPKCFRHMHEELLVSDPKNKKKKFWLDRCAEESCHYGFDIKPFVGGWIIDD